MLILYKNARNVRFVLFTKTSSVSGSGSFEVLPLAMMLGNGSGTDFGASQCIPMGPCRLTLGVVMPLMNVRNNLLQSVKHIRGVMSKYVFT